MIPKIDQRFYDEMKEKGVTKTVYGLVYPEVEAIYLGVYANRERMAKLFDEPYTRRQNNMHEVLMNGYVKWAKDIAPIDRSLFTYSAPSSGASEAIRETIAYHGNIGDDGDNAMGRPAIHVFRGEYEGYQAYADAHRVQVVEHNRDGYEETLPQSVNDGDKFYLSQPSGIDGNIWKGYEKFMDFLKRDCSRLKVLVDLAYLGTFANPDVIIDTTHRNIEAIFFSLSKSFGTYYQRIGGIFSKTDFEGLTGNSWFKNLPSIEVGAELMRNFGPLDLPKKYKNVQEEVVGDLGKDLGADIIPSDAIFLATQPENRDENDEFKRLLTRAGKVRYCLAPRMDKKIRA